jgi:hypothetical protein
VCASRRIYAGQERPLVSPGRPRRDAEGALSYEPSLKRQEAPAGAGPSGPTGTHSLSGSPLTFSAFSVDDVARTSKHWFSKRGGVRRLVLGRWGADMSQREGAMRYVRLLLAAAGSCATMLSQGPALARTWHVHADGSGDAPTIRAAMDSAVSGDDVLLAPGTYTWASEHPPGKSMVDLKAGVYLHGEGSATNTILDAARVGRLLLGTGPGRFLVARLTIQGGQAAEGPPVGIGGGISVPFGALAIRECVIHDNVAGNVAETGGGGVYCASLEMRRCMVAANFSGVDGGGIDCSSAVIDSSEISNNNAGGPVYASNGGGVRADSATISDCVFYGNTVGGLVGAMGGGIAISGSAKVVRTKFDGNHADGGGMAGAFGGSARIGRGSQVSQCEFVNGSSFDGAEAKGGAIYADGSVTIDRCVFANISTTTSFPERPGVAAVDIEASAVITRCTFVSTVITHDTFHPPKIGISGLTTGGTVSNCIFVDARVGYACGGTATYTCCDLYANELGNMVGGVDGGGNFPASPGFCAADPIAADDFSISAGSPCARGHHPVGSETCGTIGAADPVCGTTVTQKPTWTQLKRTYR